MKKYKIGIKVTERSIPVAGIKIIRNMTKLPLSEIQNRPKSNAFIYECDALDDHGLDLIIEMYESLNKEGIHCTLYELGFECTIDVLRNRKQTHKEIAEESEKQGLLQKQEHQDIRKSFWAS